MRIPNMMSTALAAILTVSVCVTTAPAAADEPSIEAEKKVEDAPLVVATFHADWCKYCKKLAPKIEALSREFEGKPVLFVTFDLTNTKVKKASAALAEEIGLGDVYAARIPTTGFALVVDREKQKILGEFDSSVSSDDARVAVEKGFEVLGVE